MLIGYARVSTADQDLTPQIEALKQAGCERLYSDKASGAKVNRPGLAEAIAYARSGDVLVVWKLDRLGRTMKGLVDLSADLDEKGIGLRSITDGIDTSGTAGRLVFNILAAMAQMERELVRERNRGRRSHVPARECLDAQRQRGIRYLHHALVQNSMGTKGNIPRGFFALWQAMIGLKPLTTSIH